MDHPERERALVLVDELDAHMHPEWQKQLVSVMKKRFPQLQVIATTHSPLVVGNMEPGEVIRVQRGSDPSQIEVGPMDSSFQGWRADQILTSQAFGLGTTIDAKTMSLQEEYEALLGKADRGTADEQRFQELADQLEETIPLSPETSEARQAQELVS